MPSALSTFFVSHGSGPWPFMKHRYGSAYDKLEAIADRHAAPGRRAAEGGAGGKQPLGGSRADGVVKRRPGDDLRLRRLPCAYLPGQVPVSIRCAAKAS